MRFRGYQLRQRLFGFLILWMTVVSLGVSISHCHAANAYVRVSPVAWNIEQTALIEDLNSDLPETHSHLILLGFELPGEHVPGPGLPAGVVQLDSPTSSAIIESESNQSIEEDFHTLIGLLFVPVVAWNVETQATDEDESPILLCHTALKRRSGVLVI